MKEKDLTSSGQLTVSVLGRYEGVWCFSLIRLLRYRIVLMNSNGKCWSLSYMAAPENNSKLMLVICLDQMKFVLRKMVMLIVDGNISEPYQMSSVYLEESKVGGPRFSGSFKVQVTLDCQGHLMYLMTFSKVNYHCFCKIILLVYSGVAWGFWTRGSSNYCAPTLIYITVFML